MRYYPVNLDIRNRSCLVVGGGPVGTRKVKTLLQCGAKVKLVSPKTGKTLDELSRKGQIEFHPRQYETKDLEGVFLVIGATNDEHLNRRIHQDAEQAGCLCNIADRPELCNFILPSIVQRGDLTIAISTAGCSPAFAKHLRLELEKQFGPEYGPFLELMGAIRKILLAREHAPEAHKALFTSLITGNLLELVKNKDYSGINKLLENILGPGFDCNQLMTKNPG